MCQKISLFFGFILLCGISLVACLIKRQASSRYKKIKQAYFFYSRLALSLQYGKK